MTNQPATFSTGPENADDKVILYIGDHPFTAKDLGDELLDEDIRTVFQTMIDKGMVPGVAPGSPWYDHIQMDDMETVDIKEDNELIANLARENRAAEAELLANYSDEARAKCAETRGRLRMAKRLVAE